MCLQAVIKWVDLINQRQYVGRHFVVPAILLAILQAFSRLGEEENLPNLETLEVIETFCLLYKGNLNEINTLAKLHWFMFSKYQYNSENLPPICGALKYKTFCSHHVTLTLKCAVLSKQDLPSFLNYCWEILENNIYWLTISWHC